MEPWKPVYPRPKDRRVQLESCELQTYVSDRRPVISLSGKKPDHPACFWIDREHIFLRLDWALWHPVDASNLQFTAALCGAYYCRILLATDDGVKEMVAPVFHVEERPPELFSPRGKPVVRGGGDSDEEEEMSPAERKRKAIFQLAAAVPMDLDAKAFRNVVLKGERMDLVVSSDDKAILFAVFPDNAPFVASPPESEGAFSNWTGIPVECLESMARQRAAIVEMEPFAEILMAIVAGKKTLDSMRLFWADQLKETDISLVEYPDYEEFLRGHFPSNDDDGDGTGDGGR